MAKIAKSSSKGVQTRLTGSNILDKIAKSSKSLKLTLQDGAILYGQPQSKHELNAQMREMKKGLKQGGIYSALLGNKVLPPDNKRGRPADWYDENTIPTMPNSVALPDWTQVGPPKEILKHIEGALARLDPNSPFSEAQQTMLNQLRADTVDAANNIGTKSNFVRTMRILASAQALNAETLNERDYAIENGEIALKQQVKELVQQALQEQGVLVLPAK